MKNARDKAVWFAAANRVENQTPFVDRNDANLPAGDVVIGYLADPKNQEASMTFLDPTRYNSVQVRVQRTAQRNGSVPLTFAAIIGMRSANLKLSATATMVDRVIGFRPTPETGNAMILPIRMHIVTFTQMMSPLAADDYRWDEATQKVEKGSDGINEVEFFPEKDAPGNFGYLDIGIEDNNSNVELGEQLVNGITPADLAAYGGQLVLGDNGTLTLPGIPGQRDSLLSVLESMVGQTRVIPLYNSISGSGSGAEVTIVGFGGIRVMQVDRKGDGRLTVQPAFVSDNNVVIGTRPPVGRFVYAPPQLSR
jgi:hypothetical protein